MMGRSRSHQGSPGRTRALTPILSETIATLAGSIALSSSPHRLEPGLRDQEDAALIASRRVSASISAAGLFWLFGAVGVWLACGWDALKTAEGELKKRTTTSQ